MNTALQSHLIPFDLPADKWSAYYEARLVLVCALAGKIPPVIWVTIKSARTDNLRFPINSRLERPSQAVAPIFTSGVST